MKSILIMVAIMFALYFVITHIINTKKDKNRGVATAEKKDLLHHPWVWIVSIALIFAYVGVLTTALLLALLFYQIFYFKSAKFKSLKDSISSYVSDCNDLNSHIEELKGTFSDLQKTDYGEAHFQNTSKYKYKKAGFENIKYAPNVYDCSKTVCNNAQRQPFKYMCKYFNIKPDEATLSNFEEALNNFSAAEEGKVVLYNQREALIQSISSSVPKLIRISCPQALMRNLGFNDPRFNELYFPQYTFRYVSSGGKSGEEFTVTLDVDMLTRFVGYLSELVKFRKSAAGQRALMTPSLRKSILERDNYTCKICNNSVSKEPNLLVEVDHIIPISRGGITSEENLQALCWRCNRSKGSKIL